MTRPLLLLTREGCGLCEEFREEFLAEFPQLAGALQLADVDSRPGWAGRYGLMIPVLLDDEGTVLAETRFDADAIRERLGLAHG
ncbi:MAG: hypothetical protein NVS9B10_19290 [Nevskia sp.]